MAERLLEGLVREGRNHCRSQLTGGPGATPAPRRAAPVYGAVLKVRIHPSSGESIKPRRQMLQTRGVGSGGQAGARLPHHHEERVVSADLSNPLGSTPPGGAGIHHTAVSSLYFWWSRRVPSPGCRVRLLCCRRCRVQLAVTLLDPPSAEMALHCDADMVRAVVGARQVKFLSSPAGSQSQNALAQARCAGFASR